MAVSLLTAAGAWQLESRWHMLWLMRSYIYTEHQAAGRFPQLDERLLRLAQLIRSKAQSQDYDEILVVGHSSGCMMAGLALELALAQPLVTRSSWAFLTLGHWWPLLNGLPAAQAQRQALARLCSHPSLHWVDVSAQADGCCFAFVDPRRSLHADEVMLGGAAFGPHLVSARWHTLFPAEQYNTLKRDRFRFHFQYIFTTPQPGVCDFYAITAGPLSLAQRFKNVPSAVQEPAKKAVSFLRRLRGALRRLRRHVK